MVRVCQREFPKGYYKGQKGDGFYIDDLLKMQLDVLLKNIKDDWDFTILITGGGEVRVGKSVLAMQIAAYWINQLKELYDIEVPFSVENNLILEGNKLIKKGNELGQSYPYSPLIFDEAGADLEGKKIMRSSTQDVLDFYRECGQYNLLNILVLPEFFDLPKGIALSRSICLIDVYTLTNDNDIFQRGYFKFFSRRNKKQLYIKGKRELDYDAYKYNFNGKFFNFYPVNEKEYRKLKQEALSRRESKRRNKFQYQRDACWYLLTQDFGMTQKELAIRMENLTKIFVAQNTVSDALTGFGVNH